MADFKVDSNGNGGAAPLYFGLGPVVKFLIDKIVLPSPLSTTGNDEEQLSPVEERFARLQENARIRALGLNEEELFMAGHLYFIDLSPALQAKLTERWNSALIMPPMWNRDP